MAQAFLQHDSKDAHFGILTLFTCDNGITDSPPVLIGLINFLSIGCTELFNCLVQKELQDQSWEMETIAYFMAVCWGLYASIREGLLWYLPGGSRGLEK